MTTLIEKLKAKGSVRLLRNFGQLVRDRVSGNQGTILSVNISNGRFRALSLINHEVHKGWEKPELVESTDMLRQALREAIQLTEFTGTHLAIILDHKHFLTRTLQLPPMPICDLLPLLERKAEQEKTWEGPIAWRHRFGSEARGKRNIHLEIWPQYFIDDLVGICEELNLQLQQLAPISALSESQLSTLPVEPGDATLLITIYEGKIMFIAGREDGTPILTRHLASTHDLTTLGERIGTEVNRTIMYVIQQTNLNIPQIWFLGEGDVLSLEDIQPHVSTAILPCPVSPDWKYWLWVGATLSINLDTNFTPPHVLHAPLRNVLAKCVAAGIAGLLLLGVSAIGMLEGYAAKNADSAKAIVEKVRSLEHNERQWQAQLVTLQNKRQWIQTVTGSHSPSLEGPFLGYLGTILPTHTVLEKASIIHKQTTWEIELSGNIVANLSESLSSLEHLTRQLEHGPFHVTVQPNWRDQLLTQTRTSSPQPSGETRFHFTLKGQIT